MAANPLGDSILDFSVDLYKQLLTENGYTGNTFYSPFSISAALSMALAGARNDTAKQLSAVLRVDGQAIHEHFSNFLSKLGGYAPDVKLHVANRMYSEQTFPVLESYISLLQTHFNTTIESVDFKNSSEVVRAAINRWVEDVTSSKIKDLLPYKSVDDSTLLVLVNAIYFKGLWSTQFDPKATRPYDFNCDTKTTIKVDMMFQQNNFKMAHSDELGVTALEVPYRGAKTSMVVLLPDEIEGLVELEKRLTAYELARLVKDLRYRSDVMLYLPKFKLEQTINLKQMLEAMGIKDFFAPEADLSGISEAGNLAASEVFHKAFVEISEEGTEAAAATAIVMMYACSVVQRMPCTFVVNRPFMFFIRSLDPELVLFMGSVRDL